MSEEEICGMDICVIQLVGGNQKANGSGRCEDKKFVLSFFTLRYFSVFVAIKLGFLKSLKQNGFDTKTNILFGIFSIHQNRMLGLVKNIQSSNNISIVPLFVHVPDLKSDTLSTGCIFVNDIYPKIIIIIIMGANWFQIRLVVYICDFILFVLLDANLCLQYIHLSLYFLVTTTFKSQDQLMVIN